MANFMPPMMLPTTSMGYGGMQAMPQSNPYFQYDIPAGGFSNPTSANAFANMYGNAVGSGASRDVGMANAMASVMNANTSRDIAQMQAQKEYDALHGQAKYTRANKLDELMQQFMLGQMTNETNRYGFDAQKYGADRGLEGQLGVANISRAANQYNTDANRDVALANQQNQLSLAGLNNSGQLDVARVQNEAPLLTANNKQARFNAIMPFFMSLLGGPGASAPGGPSPQASEPPASFAPTQVAQAPQPPSPITPASFTSNPLLGMTPQGGARPPMPGPSFASAPAPQLQSPDAPQPGSQSRWAGMFQDTGEASPTSRASLAQMAGSYGGGTAARPRLQPQRGPGAMPTATPQSPDKPPWLIGNYPSIG